MTNSIESPDFLEASGGSPPDISDDETRSVTRDFYFSIIPEALTDAPVSDRAVRLYCVLDRYAGKNRLAWPSRKAIAKRLGWCTSKVDSAIKDLVEAGFLTVKHDFGPDGDGLQRSSHYLLHSTPRLVKDDDASSDKTPDGTRVVSEHAPGSCSSTTPVRVPARTRFVSEHAQRKASEREPVNKEPRNESHADCVGSVASAGGRTLSSSAEVTGRVLMNFEDDEPTPAQSIPLREFSDGSQPQPKPQPRTKSKPKKSDELASALAQADRTTVDELFEAWAETGKGKSHPSPDRLGLIARALVLWEFPAEDVRDALTGWVNDPWEDRPLHKDVAVLLRDPSQVEKFRDLKRRPPDKKRDPSAGIWADTSDVKRYEDFDWSTAFGRTPQAESESA